SGRPVTLLSLSSFPPPPTPPFYTLSLHDALPISLYNPASYNRQPLSFRHLSQLFIFSSLLSLKCTRGHLSQLNSIKFRLIWTNRSEEHTSELQSRFDLVCRLLLEKKKLIRDAHSY